MGDHATFSNPSDATFEKGKSKEVPQDMSMDEESSSESENEMADNDEEDDGQDNLEPIDASNIIQGGRRTRGKTVDYAEAAKGLDDMEDEDDDEEYESREDNNNDDDQMRD
ncbi:hypothetical protein PENANT_c045G09702 [Penicillium antarcticum]|uniref:Histone chaperone domain-containing protein n=1 Tax=Penicillium antarcticum TaxID=416450 RepID=A0A1V6PRQ7_9EURO|nr:uncharacterized protein N7508_001770 [Penicillium antarcticum]KAJ5317262.1 hypothetical protein N7508_001770 [Penicillium antarcticum]OQD79685.1 hypothetical protein PENANT_c045G09702 [Penicillium antarcticum]